MNKHPAIQTKGELENTLSEFFAAGSNQLVIENGMGSFDNHRTVYSDLALNSQKFRNGRQMLAIPIHRDRPCVTMIFQFG